MKHQRVLILCATTSLALLSACRIGPKYTTPPVPTPPAFKESTPDAYKSALPGAWQPARPQDASIKGKWWEMFKEPELDQLEDQLDINNQNIAQYFQNFMSARAQVSEARAGYFPTVTTTPAVTRTSVGGAAGSAATAGTGTTTGGTTGGISPATASPTSTTPTKGRTTIGDYSLPFDVSWEPDLWGRVRNTVLEYRNAAQVSAADLENERLTEQAALAEYFFELRGQDALQDLYNRTIAADRKSLELTRALYDTGIDNQEAVAQAEVTLEDAEAAGIGIAVNRALYEHAIATLIGNAASTFSMPVKLLTTPV